MCCNFNFCIIQCVHCSSSPFWSSIMSELTVHIRPTKHIAAGTLLFTKHFYHHVLYSKAQRRTLPLTSVKSWTSSGSTTSSDPKSSPGPPPSSSIKTKVTSLLLVVFPWCICFLGDRASPSVSSWLRGECFLLWLLLPLLTTTTSLPPMISPTGIWSHEFWESEGLTGQCSPSMLLRSVVRVLSVYTLNVGLSSSIMNCHTNAMLWTILSTNLHRPCTQLST